MATKSTIHPRLDLDAQQCATTNVSTPRKVQRSSTLVISNWKIHEVIIEKSVPNPFLFVNLIHFQLSFQGLLTLNSDRVLHTMVENRTAAFMTFHQHRIVAREVITNYWLVQPLHAL